MRVPHAEGALATAEVHCLRMLHLHEFVPPRKSSSSPTAKSPDSASLRWITATNPREFKSKRNMQAVRQTAMGSYLQSTKNHASDKDRAPSEASDHSRSSLGSQSATKLRTIKTPKVKAKKSDDKIHRLSQSTSSSQEAPHHDAQVARTRPHQSTLTQTPIVVPIRSGHQYRFDLEPVPDLRCLGNALDPFGTMFQSRNTRVKVEKLKIECSKYFGTEGLGRHWIPECLSYAHTFLSTLYMASAYDDVVHNREIESLETAALRQDVIHFVGGHLTDVEQSVADHNIIAVSQLILGDVISRSDLGLRYHQMGIARMIEQRGGLQTLGVNGQLASAVSWANLATAALQEASPTRMYVDYCEMRALKTYPLIATIPESPLYHPHGKYMTIERSANCNANAQKLLEDVRTMMEDLLDTNSPRRAGSSNKSRSAYDRIIQSRSLQPARRTAILKTKNWKYEAIRLAAIVQAQAMFDEVPLSEALDRVQVPESQQAMYSSSAASFSNDSISSTFEFQDVSPATDVSQSPMFGSNSESFPFNHRLSNSSTFSRPSLSTLQSSSSDVPLQQQVFTRIVSGNTMLRQLREALEKSDITDCWSDMAGVLLWIGLVMGAASNKSKDKNLRRYFSATTMRACIMLCFEHPEAIHATMLRMTDVVAALGKKSGEGQMIRNDSFVSRKRSKN
ncbi:hypothetical protein J4E85_007582 [Alternaria conjuncta]|uniref:uncharacterized protein n=1 Tax=Alternaria conjuncta TaxID=181017 RepID=UPI0022208EAB|nr:uncharacterized protein J4E85_007582 [Alternaria conjuncta]KAI4924467.1 hypothetical protein J4E85_007582 [Alternaria conjuncta]